MCGGSESGTDYGASFQTRLRKELFFESPEMFPSAELDVIHAPPVSEILKPVLLEPTHGSRYVTVRPEDRTHLVEGSGSRQDDVRVLHLDGPLAETHQVRADPDGPACHLSSTTPHTHTRTELTPNHTTIKYYMKLVGVTIS